jgi:hypothetical protein
MQDETSAREIHRTFEGFKKLFSKLFPLLMMIDKQGNEESRFFLEYWYIDVINKIFVTELSGKSITASIDAANYETSKKYLVQTMAKLLPMLNDRHSTP